MPESRRRFLAAVGASLAIAGCQNEGGGTTPTEEPTATPASGGGGATVAVSDHDEYGEILVDGDGVTLYMFDSDSQGAGASTCSGACLDAWPAFTTDGGPTAGDGVSAELTTFDRDGGDTQVAANGWPLYYFANDGGPGDVSGQGVNGVWWVLRPDGTPVRASGDTATATPTPAAEEAVAVRSHDEHGDILVDGEGMTLYMFDNDEQGAGESSCTGGCIDNWPLLTVDGEPSAGDAVEAELTTFEHGETGETQVAANGWPLYYFTPDEEPSDANGQGANDVWWVLDPSGEPIRSSGGSTPTSTATEENGMY